MSQSDNYLMLLVHSTLLVLTRRYLPFTHVHCISSMYIVQYYVQLYIVHCRNHYSFTKAIIPFPARSVSTVIGISSVCVSVQGVADLRT